MSMDEIYLEQDGDHAILLLHAYTSYSRDFRVFSNALEEAGYTVYAPHFSGHGIEDPDGVIQHGIDEWVKDGQDALDRLKAKGYEKISVFGLSLGGVVASYLALENPDLISAGTFSAPVAGNYGLSIEDEFKEWYYNKKEAMGYSQEEVDDFYQDYVQEGLAKVTEGIEAFRQKKWLTAIMRLPCPFLLAKGEKIKILPLNTARPLKLPWSMPRSLLNYTRMLAMSLPLAGSVRNCVKTFLHFYRKQTKLCQRMSMNG